MERCQGEGHKGALHGLPSEQWPEGGGERSSSQGSTFQETEEFSMTKANSFQSEGGSQIGHWPLPARLTNSTSWYFSLIIYCSFKRREYKADLGNLLSVEGHKAGKEGRGLLNGNTPYTSITEEGSADPDDRQHLPKRCYVLRVQR